MNAITITCEIKDPTEAEKIINVENALFVRVDSYSVLELRDFMREPSASNPLERPCVAGEQSCVFVYALKHPVVDGEHWFIMREFYLPHIWKKIVEDAKLPKKGTLCYYCKQFRAEGVLSAARYRLKHPSV